MLAPVMPLPMITTSADFGKSRVERWPVSRAEGSECQKESVESSEGRAQGSLLRGTKGRLFDILKAQWVRREDKSSK